MFPELPSRELCNARPVYEMSATADHQFTPDRAKKTLVRSLATESNNKTQATTLSPLYLLQTRRQLMRNSNARLILALSSVVMLVGCSAKQAEISQGMSDIDRQRDIQKQQVEQHADVLKERISENAESQQKALDATKAELDAQKKAADERKDQIADQADFAKKNIDDQVKTSKKVVDRNAEAAKAALKQANESVQ